MPSLTHCFSLSIEVFSFLAWWCFQLWDFCRARNVPAQEELPIYRVLYTPRSTPADWFLQHCFLILPVCCVCKLLAVQKNLVASHLPGPPLSLVVVSPIVWNPFLLQLIFKSMWKLFTAQLYSIGVIAALTSDICISWFCNTWAFIDDQQPSSSPSGLPRFIW